jgi:hypothetical protein
LSETAADGRVIHGKKIEVEARQGGQEESWRSQDETRAEDGDQEDGFSQEDQDRGEEKEEGGHAQEDAICCEENRCRQSAGGQKKEAIRQACKTGGTRRKNPRRKDQ